MPEETSVFEDLFKEYAQLDAVLAALSPEQWAHDSAAAGWTIADVVLHLAQSEELVLASIAGERAAFAREQGERVDDLADQLVAAERGTPPVQLLERWRTATRSTAQALRDHPPHDRLAWVAIPLSPRTLAATRIAESWAHALDVTVPLELDYPDTARLRHVARLAHRTLPYAFKVEGEEGGPVYCELTGPDGELWQFGDAHAPSTIRGPIGDFCRVGARRLVPEQTSLKADGPHAYSALRVLRNYAA